MAKLEHNVSSLYKEYSISEKHKKILLDFDEAESKQMLSLMHLAKELVIFCVDAQSILFDRLRG